MEKPAIGRKEWEIPQAIFEQLRSRLTAAALDDDQPKSDKPAPPDKGLLSAEVFEKFLNCLAPDQDSAGAEYVRIREKLVFIFERRGVPLSDAEALADETINRAC